MKICLISNLYKPYTRGGAERVVEMMTAGLAQAGHESIVISTKPDRGLTIECEKNIKIYRFKPLNLFYYLNDYKHNALIRLFWHAIDMFNLPATLQVRKILKTEQPDIVITHNLKGLSLLTPQVIKNLKIKHLHVLHDVQLSVPSGLIIKGEENSWLVNSWPVKLYELFCKKLFNSPTVVISPSNWLLNFYTTKGFFTKSKKIVLRNPIAQSGEYQERPKINTFLFVGQLEKSKGIDWLVNFWEKYNITQDLLIAGKGTLTLAPTNNNIKLLGQLTIAQVFKNLAKVDFLIVPSLCYENSPTIIPMALATGTPTLVANIGGAAELIEDNKTGFVFEPANEPSFATKLQLALDVSQEEFNKMQKACQVAAVQLSLEKYIDQVLNILQ